MPAVNMEIVSAEYTVEDNEPTILLFGRSPDGKSVTAKIVNFMPYCYFKHNEIITPIILKECKDMIVQHEIVELESNLMKEKYTKIYVKLPQNVPTIRHRYEKQATFVSADILFPLRFIYDNNVGHFATINGNDLPADNYTTNIVIGATSDAPGFIANPGPLQCPLCTLRLRYRNQSDHQHHSDHMHTHRDALRRDTNL